MGDFGGMASITFRSALFVRGMFGAGMGALLLSSVGAFGPAQAAPLSLQRPATAGSAIIEVAKDGPRFFHGKKTQSAYCLRRNYWWFYRPYTTKQEDFPRCEPYFHYPDGARGARADPNFK